MAAGGLTLDMSPMREVRVDFEAKLAHVGPGCLMQDVDRATQEHGLATVPGFVSEVGVGGLTLGGGFGYLMRRFGWAVDNLADVEIVTTEGEIRSADRNTNSESPNMAPFIRDAALRIAGHRIFRAHYAPLVLPP